MLHQKIWLVICVGSLAAGCDFVAGGSEINPDYCRRHPDVQDCQNYCAMHAGDVSCPDAPVVITGCKAEPTKCVGAMPVCDTAMDKCVECTAASHDLCVGMVPVCGVDESCRACTQHSECASEVCLPDGACADSNDVAYVNSSGGGSVCTQAMPCKTLTAGITAAKPIVKVKGIITEPGGIVLSGKTLRVFADAGASISRNSAGAVIELATATTLELNELAIVDGLGANGVGVLLSASGSNNQLTLNHATVRGCAGVGVKADGGTVTLTGATIMANKGGGVLVAGGTFKITNTFIMDNGDASGSGSDFGGVQLSSISTSNVFEQNTVAYNHQKAIALNSPGVTCAVAAFSAARNIVTANNTGNTFPAAQTQGVGCTFPNSYIQSGSDLNDLKFVSLSPVNLHLTAASPATVRDVAGVTACSGPDIDGDLRPQVGLCDFGADEYKP